MHTEYKGYKIEFDEQDENFRVQIGNDGIGRLSLKQLKKYIDQIDRKDFKRVDCFLIRGGLSNDKYIPVTVTSSQGPYDVWIIDKATKRRRKIAQGSLALDTPENVKLIDQIRAMEVEVSEIQSARMELLHKLTHYEHVHRG